MAKKIKTEPYLIEDVAPKNAEEICKVAKRCRFDKLQKQNAAEQEAIGQDKLRELIKKAGLKPIDGKIIIRAEGLLIEVSSREDAIKIKDESSENE